MNGMAMLRDILEDQVVQVVFLSNLSMVASDTEDLQRATSHGHRAPRIMTPIKPVDFNRAAATSGTPGFAV